MCTIAKTSKKISQLDDKRVEAATGWATVWELVWGRSSLGKPWDSEQRLGITYEGQERSSGRLGGRKRVDGNTKAGDRGRL